MNIISPITTLSPGIRVDEDTMTITVPSGKSRLGVRVVPGPDDSAAVTSKSVTLTFLQHGTDVSAEAAKFVTGENGQLDYHSTRHPDPSGIVHFDLDIPSALPAGLDIYLRLSGERHYAQKTNEWTLSLKETVTDHTAEVDKLVIVSGDKQFTTLDGDDFAPLVVRAFHGVTPVQNATVTFTSASPAASASVVGTPAPTDPDGVTRVLLAKHTQPGVFTVTARCGTASPVVFNLALGPQSSQLELTFEWHDIAIHLRNDNSGVCRAYVHTRGTAIGWPYIHGHAAVSAPEVIMLRQTAGGGESASVELISDATGLLSPVTGNGALEIVPKKKGNASVGFDIFILPLRLVHNGITVRITDA